MLALASSPAALLLLAQAEEPAPPPRDPQKDVVPRRAGPSEPQQFVPPLPDPSQVPAPAAALPRESLPVADRWRIMQALGMKRPWFDPYNQNLIKGDLPVWRDWFVNVGL